MILAYRVTSVKNARIATCTAPRYVRNCGCVLTNMNKSKFTTQKSILQNAESMYDQFQTHYHQGMQDRKYTMSEGSYKKPVPWIILLLNTWKCETQIPILNAYKCPTADGTKTQLMTNLVLSKPTPMFQVLGETSEIDYSLKLSILQGLRRC